MIDTTEELRDYLIGRLHAELVGPDAGLPAVQSGVGEPSLRAEEILRQQDPPRVRYGAGVLFPPRLSTSSQEDPGGESDPDATPSPAGEEDGSPNPGVRKAIRVGLEADTEQEVNRANEFLPSAMGVTAMFKPCEYLTVSVSAARYEQYELTGSGWTNDNGEYRPYMGWRRVPVRDEIRIDLADSRPDSRETRRYPVGTATGGSNLQLHVFLRPSAHAHGAEALRIATITLLNETVSERVFGNQEDCFFQCGFSVAGPSGVYPFVDYPTGSARAEPNAEVPSLRLLYRDRQAFSIGHGCSGDWGEVSEGRARVVRTESLPVAEVAPVLPTEIEELNLSMWDLAADEAAALATAEKLCELYDDWITGLVSESESSEKVPDDLQAAAAAHIEHCRECLRRMREGASLLREDEEVRRVFAIANRAMARQQVHYGLSTDGIREWVVAGSSLELEEPYSVPNYDSIKCRWRPFQFAFVLMNLVAFARPNGPGREIVDVIWFPTGGGKTEAYLGLSAFAILWRRLRRPANTGVCVLMRYTLRLLTTQQYQRASSLICALELERRADPQAFGIEPITIGLWVGQGVTPNREAKAVEAFNRMTREGGGDNPFVLLSCPWCGARMGAVKFKRAYRVMGYRKVRNPQRVKHVCEDPDCEFSDEQGLPLLVVDESIYRNPPELLIGTADKFALLPWYPAAAGLFGLPVERVVDPPDLVIQDELHLISGPLGTMVGHYETVVGALCTRATGIPVKIVGATATIARAAEQVRDLYGRDKASLFPPQGLRWGASFFAEERPDKPGRMYVGVLPTALPSGQTALIRVISALLQGPAMSGASARVRDPYWTVMCYFNSIRELGSAATLVSADIPEYLRVLHDRFGLSPRWDGADRAKRRFLHSGSSLELTSRVSRGQISEALAALFRPLTDERPRDAVDICLATNMIQVGLDVQRLGTMVVVGQPKTTAEYIQATSRIGRQHPGLVATLLNPGKPRDRSHYEHFRAYHESFYRWVEPTSVTPFAAPVRDRALHALAITLVRYWGDDQMRRSPAGVPGSLIREQILQTVRQRVESVDPDETEATLDRLSDFFAEWERLPAARYGDFAPPDEPVPLMHPDGSSPLPIWENRSYPTPSSMRSVDASCDLALITDYPD